MKASLNLKCVRLYLVLGTTSKRQTSNALRRMTFQWIQRKYSTDFVMIFMETSIKKTLPLPHAANVLSISCLLLKSFSIYLFFRYTCTFIYQHINDKFYKWNVSVSDHCCQHCDGVVYKADSVIETIFHEDECETIETSICRILPGYFLNIKSLPWRILI